jgi:predicted nucleic acid-binding protein
MSEEKPRPRVVFDCMVYLQATVNESGPAAALLRLVDNDKIALFVSREVLSRTVIESVEFLRTVHPGESGEPTKDAERTR